MDEGAGQLVIRLDAMKDLATQEWKYKIVRGVMGKNWGECDECGGEKRRYRVI